MTDIYQYISRSCVKTIRATIRKKKYIWKIKTNNINIEIETKAEMVVFVQSTFLYLPWQCALFVGFILYTYYT